MKAIQMAIKSDRHFNSGSVPVHIAARRLRCSRRTVRRWIKQGILPASRIGRRAWAVSVPAIATRLDLREGACFE